MAGEPTRLIWDTVVSALEERQDQGLLKDVNVDRSRRTIKVTNWSAYDPEVTIRFEQKA